MLNNNGLGFKKDRKPIKDVYHKKKNHPIYKYTHCKRSSYLKPLCFDKLKISKGNNPRPSGKTNAHESKKIWVPKVKPSCFAGMLCCSNP